MKRQFQSSQQRWPKNQLICGLSVCLSVCLLSAAPGQETKGGGPKKNETGVTVNESTAFQGYTLVAPMRSKSTYLIDMDGRIVNEWKSEYTPALSAYLLADGSLLRPCSESGFGGPGGPRGRGQGGPGQRGRGGPGGMPGAGGRIQKFDWDGKLVWDFDFSKTFKSKNLKPHHDICPLPNGNVLFICTDTKTEKEAIKAGRLPTTATAGVMSDAIVEVKPTGKKGGKIVWEWYAWDHLIQDVHEKKDNFGEVSEHPELIDVNFVTGMMAKAMQDPEQLEKLRSLGYVGGGGGPAPNQGGQSGSRQGARDNRGGRGPGGRGPGGGADWLHTNSVEYNAKLDQIMLSIHEFSEVWIIDHSTTTKEAASHKGGKYGKGGDLLFRWGNPKAYRSGTNTDQKLFAQHCAHWIEDGLPGAGNMLVFNNGGGRQDGSSYSSADEVILPVGDDGSYKKEEYVAFEPYQAKWSYGAPDKDFYSFFISGCQRLPNGNTFICSGAQSRLFEVTPEGKVVWQYTHPGGGFGGPGGADMFAGLVPGFLAGMLGVDDKQQAELKGLQEGVDAKLKELLSEEQFEKLNANNGFPGFGGPGGFPAPPKVGEVISEAKQKEIKLTDEQSTRLAAIQKETTSSLNKILTKEQRNQIAEMEERFAGGPGGFGGPPQGFGGPGGFGPPGGGQGRPDRGGSRPDSGGRRGPPEGFGGPGGRGGPPQGFGGPGGGRGGPSGIFRSYRYAADYSGLQGKELTPGKLLSEVAEEKDRPQGPQRRGGRRPESGN